MGIGLVLITPQVEVDSILNLGKGFGDQGFVIGEIRERPEGSSPICYVD